MEENKKYHPAELDTVQQKALRIIKGTASFKDRFIPEHKDLVNLIGVLRAMGCTIVFTTGVWDLIHIGHAEYILHGKKEAAKRYPNTDHVIMVVGVDTDELTKQRKGPDRPIVPQDERLKMLGHLRAVDVLTLQYEHDSLQGIIEHDVRVVSQSTEDLPEIEKIQCRCAHVVNLPPQAETSTTARVRRLTLDGAANVLLKIEKGLTTTLQEVRNELQKK